MKPENPQPSRPSVGRKLAVVAAVVAFTTGLSGYFMGLRQTDRSAADRRSPSATQPADHVTPQEDNLTAPPAPRYADLRDRTRQPNHDWINDVAKLPPAPAFTATSLRLTSEELTALIARRESRRAFAGAPPTVPHPIDQHSSTSCLACHGHPTRIGKIDVPQISHPPYTNCIQCHAPAGGPGPALAAPPTALATPVLANSFVGQPAPTSGTRAFAGAPPTIPHPTAMRQNCVTCHGPGGSSDLKTSHPQRQNCLQCHALDAASGTQPKP